MDSSMYIYIAIVFVVMVGGGMIFARIQAKKFQAQVDNMIDFEQVHPTFSKIFFTGKNDKGFLAVHKINGVQFLSDQNIDQLGLSARDAWSLKSGDEFQEFRTTEGMGFYILPGEVTLNISYSETKPGFVHKSVTKYTEPLDYTVNAEANKTSQLAYSMKEKQFTFTEL